MFDSLRLAASGLCLIFTVLIFTVAAQQTSEDKNNLSVEKENSRQGFSEANHPSQPSLTKPKPREPAAEKPPAEPEKKPEDSSTTDASGVLDSNDATVYPGRYRPRRGMREYNFEPGIAPFDPTHYTGEKTYNTAGRKLGTAHFRIGRVLGTTKAITFTYLYGITPLVIARANEVKNPAFISDAATPDVPKTKRETTYGFGFSPAQFRFTFFPKSQMKPFAQVGAGILFFNKSMPIPESRRLQFTGEYGGGFIVHTDRRRDRFWLLGYRYYHISNANIGGKQWNPGYNASIFYIGYSFFK